MTQQQIQPKLSKTTFCRDYVSGSQRVAIAVLPDGDRTLSEWQQLWQQALNSPTN